MIIVRNTQDAYLSTVTKVIAKINIIKHKNKVNIKLSNKSKILKMMITITKKREVLKPLASPKEVTTLVPENALRN
jgi:hypothetical protein